MKTIKIRGVAVTLYPGTDGDTLVNFTELCQALGADPGVNSPNMAQLTQIDATNGLVIPGRNLPQFALMLVTDDAAVNAVNHKWYNDIMGNLYNNFSAGVEPVENIQRRGRAQQNREQLQRGLDVINKDIEQAQAVVARSANPPAGVNETPIQTNMRVQSGIVAKQKVANLTINAEHQQRQINALNASIAEIGEAPDKAANMLNSLYGNLQDIVPPAPSETMAAPAPAPAPQTQDVPATADAMKADVPAKKTASPKSAKKK